MVGFSRTAVGAGSSLLASLCIQIRASPRQGDGRDSPRSPGQRSVSPLVYGNRGDLLLMSFCLSAACIVSRLVHVIISTALAVVIRGISICPFVIFLYVHIV